MLKIIKKLDWYYKGVILEGLIFVFAIVLNYLFKTDIFHNFHIDGYSLIMGTAFVFPPFVLFIVLSKTDLKPFKKIQEILDNIINYYFGSCSIIKLATISLIAGLSEEAFFRGFLQAVIANNFGEFAGILVANLIFGALHLITLTYGIIVFFIGCYLSAILHYTDSLFVLMWCHFVYDFFALLYLRYSKK